ncbi:MAG: hypothetical protein IKR69_03175 [Bacteroidales bacterium]|nr:hypothetical protein [Bacteroidales bacterium]
MKKIALFLSVLLLAGCHGDDLPGGSGHDVEGVYHGMIELGEKLEDPYSVTNVTKAIEALYPTKAGTVQLSPTNIYVRFLPENEEQFETLRRTGAVLLDHPVDYRIVREGDYYHDPSIDEENITWQYAVVSPDYVYPEGIYYEKLDDCYIAENDPATRSGADGIDWEAVERQAYFMTGNGDLYVPPTKASSAVPEGRITIVDPDFNGGQPFGVSGVMVSCNSFVKFDHCYCDRDGYYKMKKKYSAKPRYRLVFANSKGFNIGFNLVLIPGSISTLGKGSPSGMDAEITSSSDGYLWRRSCVNNAAYDYLSRCAESDMDLTPPPGGIRFWIFKDLDASSAVMMHHGAFLEGGLIQKYLGPYMSLIKIFLPDITIGTKNNDSYADIYSTVCHELSHASHYSQVGNSYWNKYIDYIAKSYLSSGGKTYGNGTDEGAGYCEVGETWAYFMQSIMYQERYGGTVPSFGTSFWFHPQVLRYLYERGMKRSEILAALTPEVTSMDDFKDQLVSLYPERETLIDQVFGRYLR